MDRRTNIHDADAVRILVMKDIRIGVEYATHSV